MMPELLGRSISVLQKVLDSCLRTFSFDEVRSGVERKLKSETPFPIQELLLD